MRGTQLITTARPWQRAEAFRCLCRRISGFGTSGNPGGISDVPAGGIRRANAGSAGFLNPGLANGNAPLPVHGSHGPIHAPKTHSTQLLGATPRGFGTPEICRALKGHKSIIPTVRGGMLTPRFGLSGQGCLPGPGSGRCPGLVRSCADGAALKRAGSATILPGSRPPWTWALPWAGASALPWTHGVPKARDLSDPRWGSVGLNSEGLPGRILACSVGAGERPPPKIRFPAHFGFGIPVNPRHNSRMSPARKSHSVSARISGRGCAE
mgnify:CR=1 FL=1